MELVAPNGVRATLLVDSSFDGYDDSGLKFGPPRRKERDLRRAGMRPEIDQRVVDAWLYGPQLAALEEAAARIGRGMALWRNRFMLDLLVGLPPEARP